MDTPRGEGVRAGAPVKDYIAGGGTGKATDGTGEATDGTGKVADGTGKMTTAPPKPVGKAKGAEGMKQALQIYKETFPKISAILIGTRRSDPHGGELQVLSLPP